MIPNLYCADFHKWLIIWYSEEGKKKKKKWDAHIPSRFLPCVQILNEQNSLDESQLKPTAVRTPLLVFALTAVMYHTSYIFVSYACMCNLDRFSTMQMIHCSALETFGETHKRMKNPIWVPLWAQLCPSRCVFAVTGDCLWMESFTFLTKPIICPLSRQDCVNRFFTKKKEKNIWHLYVSSRCV